MTAVPIRSAPSVYAEELGKFATGFHVGAFVANALALVFNVWLVCIHNGDQLFPSGYWWMGSGVLESIALCALLPNFRSRKQATVVLRVAISLLAISTVASLTVWYTQPFMR